MIEFRKDDGAPVSVTIEGISKSSFSYLIPPRSSQKFVTAGGAPGATTGSVRIIPVAGQTAPVSQVIFVYKPREVTVSLAGVSTLGATSFRTSSGIQAFRILFRAFCAYRLRAPFQLWGCAFTTTNSPIF